VAIVRFVAVGAAGEEELAVDLVRVGFEFRLEDSVGLIALLSFESMGDFVAVDSGDEAVSNRADRLIEVGLRGEDIDCGLWRYWSVVWGKLCDCGGVGNGVEWDGEDGQGRCSGGGRLIGQVDGRHVVVEEGVVGVDVVREISVGMELQVGRVDGE
jgi:hypothetical protein